MIPPQPMYLILLRADFVIRESVIRRPLWHALKCVNVKRRPLWHTYKYLSLNSIREYILHLIISTIVSTILVKPAARSK